jgi:DNA gyrase/topoisomerase IV subunit A
MSTKKCFVVLAVVVCLAATLWGQEPNDIAELKMTIAKLEKQIEHKEQQLKKMREELQAEREKNQKLTRICREAGINFETTESPMEVDYEVCRTPIKPAILSNSMKTLEFTETEVGALGWIDSLIIQQIIDANNAIVRIGLRTGGPISSPEYRTVWLKGVQTDGFADETSQIVNHHFVITGTKTYDTAIGSQTTLYVVEPVILSPKRLKQETLRYEGLMKQWRRGKYGL